MSQRLKFRKIASGVIPLMIGFAIGLKLGDMLMPEFNHWLHRYQYQNVTMTTTIAPRTSCYFLDSNPVTGKWEPDTETKVVRTGQTITIEARCPTASHWPAKP